MSNAYNTNSDQIVSDDPAEDAFEGSSGYEFGGRPLWFARRHYYLAQAVCSAQRGSAADQVFAVLWAASHAPEDIAGARRLWRRDPDAVFDQIEDIPEKWDIAPGSPAELEAASVVGRMWGDVEDSADRVDADGDGEAPDGAPGK